MDRALQARLAAEINGYLDAGTTAMADAEMLNPVAEYHDPHRLAREQAELFRRCPQLVAHTSQLPAPGDALTDDLAGVPVRLVRQADGSVTASLAIDSGRADLPCEERHGLIWVVLTPGASIDVAGHLGGLDGELAGYGLDGYVHDRGRAVRDQVNWKLVVDGFLETYHLRFLHSATIGPYIRTNLAPFEAVGPHVRMVTVRARYDQVRDRAPGEFDLMPYVGVVYQLFPNTILQWQGDHFETFTVFPDGSPSRSVSRVAMLVPAASPDLAARWDKNWRILLTTVLEEDFPVARDVQAALTAGAHQHLLFGRNEPALQHFHRQLAAALAG